MVCVLITDKKFHDRNETKLEKMFDTYFDTCMNMAKYISNRLPLTSSSHNSIIASSE